MYRFFRKYLTKVLVNIKENKIYKLATESSCVIKFK